MSLLESSEFEVRAISVAPHDLVLVKHHLEASDGLGFLVAKKGGDAFLVAHRSMAQQLDSFIEDMKLEVEIRTGRRPTHDEVEHAAW